MKIFITGGSGLVGSNVLSYFKENDCTVIGSHLSHQTKGTVFFDTINLKNVANFDLVNYAPDVIVHCGAMTNVDLAEEKPEESFLNTITSTRNLIELAKQNKTKFIYISTDYVFNGETGFYKESDSPNPINIYGKHKLEAEKIVLESLNDSLVIRITNVYGKEERNKNFVARLVNQVKNCQDIELSLPYDQYATPINARDVAKALWILINKKSKGIYHLASTDYLNRCQLADKIFKNFGYSQFSIERLETNKLKQNAQRPLLGGMSASKFIKENPDFQFTCIEDFLKQIKDGI
jgi:dTDP-4-dehydrorhamnose reductase